MTEYHIAAFYQFADFAEFAEKQTEFYELCERHQLIGTILLASEGLNGTVGGSRKGLEALIEFIRSDVRFASMAVKWSKTTEKPFLRMKIRLKKEIVSLGIDQIKPHQLTGTQVPPSEWNQLISDPDVLVIDTRNHYEVEVGTFENAINPNSESFREFPDYIKENFPDAKDRKIAMFCTGGIRCEKASSYLLEKGYAEVYQLQGGILEYLDKVPNQKSMWQGECFVFDRRVTVDPELRKGSFIQCHACRRPLTEEEASSECYEKGVSCPHCFDEKSGERRKAFRERQKQIELAKKRGNQHLGPH